MADNGDSTTGGVATEQPNRTREKVFHTVNACVRCRQRKTRCDPTLPRCEPCERANAHCEYYDSTRAATVSRTYITSLQETVRKLNAELKALEAKENEQDADYQTMAKVGGLVRVNDRDEPRFLGPSSGIGTTRFVMEFARQHSARKTIREVVPDQQAQEIKEKFDIESAKPTSKIYPLISSVAAPNLPNRELMEKLVDIYTIKAQYMLPLLHEPTFRREVDQVYLGSTDSTINFQVRLVIAISMQKLDTQYAGLADSYYLAALPYLPDAVRKKDLSTLQCFVLIGQYSLLTPTRTAAYWVVGMAAKLCQELGLCDEQTIEKPPSGILPNFLEIDMRRRLFWIITSMEYGLSHSLGRPSTFGVGVDNINVKIFELCDDRFITPEGLLPGHHQVMKKCIALHFFRMRLLQAEIRRTLYLKKRDAPISDTDPWFESMESRIDDWVQKCPKNDEGSGLSEQWFQGRRNTMILFMYRPSPQIPTPSLYAAQRCYDAAVFNIQLQKHQVEDGLVDVTWIFAQAINMALNTVLWSLSYQGIRQLHAVEEVVTHIDDALTAIALCASRWPGVTSAQQLYRNLVKGCLKAYENDKTVVSPGSVSFQDISSTTSQTAQSPASTTDNSFQTASSPQAFNGSYMSGLTSNHSQRGPGHPQKNGFNGSLLNQGTFSNSTTSHPSTSPSALGKYTPYGSPNIEGLGQQFPFPASSQALPAWESFPTTVTSDPNIPLFPDLSTDNQPWLASFGDVYSQYLGQPYAGATSYPMESLGEQDQLDLMATLEKDHLPDISGLASDATTFYSAHLP